MHDDVLIYWQGPVGAIDLVLASHPPSQIDYYTDNLATWNIYRYDCIRVMGMLPPTARPHQRHLLKATHYREVGITYLKIAPSILRSKVNLQPYTSTNNSNKVVGLERNLQYSTRIGQHE